jgi:hypothetical protein
MRHVLLQANTVLIILLLAVLRLAEKKGAESTPDFNLFVSSGISTIPAKIADEFGLSLPKPAFERNAVRLAFYGMTPCVN